MHSALEDSTHVGLHRGAPQEQIGFLLDELFDEANLEALARHPFANFVVQHIFEHGMPDRILSEHSGALPCGGRLEAFASRYIGTWLANVGLCPELVIVDLVDLRIASLRHKYMIFLGLYIT